MTKKKKYLRDKDWNQFLELYNKFKSIPTWTSEKHTLRGELFEFLDKYSPFYVTRNWSFTGYKTDLILTTNRIKNKENTSLFNPWEYEVLKLPMNIRGIIKELRGEIVLMICTGTVGFFSDRTFVIIRCKFTSIRKS